MRNAGSIIMQTLLVFGHDLVKKLRDVAEGGPDSKHLLMELCVAQSFPYGARPCFDSILAKLFNWMIPKALLSLVLSSSRRALVN